MDINELKIYLDGKRITGVRSLYIDVGGSEKVIGAITILEVEKTVFANSKDKHYKVELESWNKNIIRLKKVEEQTEAIETETYADMESME